MSDVFYEVDEQLRSERLRNLAARGWPAALAALVVAAIVALAIWGWQGWRDAQATKASDAYTDAVALIARGDAKGADAKLSEVAKSGAGQYRALALMQQAGLRLNEHKDADALALLDRAAGATKAPILADAARLKAAMVAMDSRPFADVQARLSPLLPPERPYHWLAREALGMAKLQSGDLKGAHGEFAALSLAQDISDPARQRARAAMALIDDGTAGSLPALTKAGLSAPPLQLPTVAPPVAAAPNASAAAPAPSTPETAAAQPAPAGNPQ